MSQELIYQTLYSSLSLADSILQIWLTVTFAVIVAAHLAGNQINNFMYLLISGLYGLAAVVLMIRDASAAFQIFHYRDMLIANGLEPWPAPRLLTQMIGIGTGILLIAGSVGTLWFVYTIRKNSKGNGS